MQKNLKYIPLVFAVMLSAVLTGCPSGGGSSSGGSGGAITPTGGGTINGLVTDFSKGTRLAGVTVTGGGQTATTDSNGAFTLSGFASGVTVAVSLDKSGYALGHGNAVIGENAAPLVVPLKKEIGTRKDYNPATNATISFSTEAGPYAVIFTANTLDTTATSLKVAVTPLDPTKEAAVLPGNLSTTGGGSTTVLSALTFAEFSIFDSAGNRVNLQAGKEAIVEMPIPPELRAKTEYQVVAAPNENTVHCYAYNPVTGQWEDFVFGKIVKSSIDGTTPVLRASIKHFSWYGGAPQTSDCYDVYGTVVSAVDGKPLPYARVEAFPGTATTSDANGNFVVTTTAGGPNSFTASRTFIDTNGSVSGTTGAKVIEFGKVDAGDLLQGLVKVPCTKTTPPPPPTPPLPPPTVTIKIGGVSLLSYKVDAFMTAGAVCAIINESVPPNGTTGAEVTGAIVKLSGPSGTVDMTENAYGSAIPGYYCAILTPTPGARYTISIDADHNGSIDGTGSAIAVGTLAWTKPTNGSSFTVAQFNSATWTDSASATAGYSVTYFASIINSGGTAGASYIGSDRQFTPLNIYSLTTPNPPLPAGTYTAQLFGFSGPYNAGGNWVLTNNISGSTVSGNFYSFGTTATPVTFMIY